RVRHAAIVDPCEQATRDLLLEEVLWDSRAVAGPVAARVAALAGRRVDVHAALACRAAHQPSELAVALPVTLAERSAPTELGPHCFEGLDVEDRRIGRLVRHRLAVPDRVAEHPRRLEHP